MLPLSRYYIAQMKLMKNLEVVEEPTLGFDITFPTKAIASTFTMETEENLGKSYVESPYLLDRSRIMSFAALKKCRNVGKSVEMSKALKSLTEPPL